jgi:uncharacterized membrane protein
VGVGRDKPTEQLRDIKVVKVDSPRTTFRFTNVPVRARVLLRGCENHEVAVKLTASKLPEDAAGKKAKPVAEDLKTVSVVYAEETVPVEFRVQLNEIGQYELSVTAEPVEGELLKRNNTSKSWVKVNDSGVRVSYFDSVRPESKFVARALIGTENMSLERTLVLGGRPAPQEGQEKLALNDVTILGDLDSSALLPSRLLELVEAVQQNGRGLIVLVTERSGGTDGLWETVLADVLPVSISGRARVLPGERRVMVQPHYVDHPVMVAAEERERSLAAWDHLPPLNGVLAGVRPKRGARVLATDQEGNPVLAVHRSEKGLVACLMADTTYNWTFTQSESQVHHLRFWRQLVMWASGKEPEVDFNVHLGTQHPALGDQLPIIASLKDRNGAPMRDAEVAVKITTPQNGRTEHLMCVYSHEEGAYVATYVPGSPGDYAVSARATRKGQDVADDTTHFSASNVDVEMEDPVADHGFLRRLAATTEQIGGSYYDSEGADKLFQMLRDRAKPVMLTRASRHDIWDSWPLYALLFGCIATEWSLRKWKGLV